MAGVAVLARALGHQVSGCDQHVYPPMSDLLCAAGITVMDGYRPEHLDPPPDYVVIGNALSRGNPAVEHVLNAGLAYGSGPQWLHDYVLAGRHVIAIAGTHGKTTTSAMVAWILECLGHSPGFLIGGMPANFPVSARLGVVGDQTTSPFVVEADEYDSAFFDKRSKFVHYRPTTLVINNIEFDHADIFADVEAIKRQFHHLVRIVPGSGMIISKREDPHIAATLAMGCWSRQVDFGDGGSWRATSTATDAFDVFRDDRRVGAVHWQLIGEHNIDNALAAIAACVEFGVDPAPACQALGSFLGVKRRLELIGEVDGVRFYDDFAHHPTAIRTTLAGVKATLDSGRLLAVVDPASNSMRMGVHAQTLGPSLVDADQAWVYRGGQLDWNAESLTTCPGTNIAVIEDISTLVDDVCAFVRAGDHVVIMSNGAFAGFQTKLMESLQGAEES